MSLTLIVLQHEMSACRAENFILLQRCSQAEALQNPVHSSVAMGTQMEELALNNVGREFGTRISNEKYHYRQQDLSEITKTDYINRVKSLEFRKLSAERSKGIFINVEKRRIRIIISRCQHTFGKTS